MPLVTIGIPTYNRAKWLRRAAESALRQDHQHLEVIISDNGSTDDTRIVCEDLCRRDSRVRAVHIAENRGATANFVEVLSQARGDFFMWLGDDDWIDGRYVSECLSALEKDETLSLAGGEVSYYSERDIVTQGVSFDVLNAWWVCRVLKYYWKVRDNGMFYGLMRTGPLRRVGMRKEMGNDWHVVAGMLAAGRGRTIRTVRLHRALGGASSSPKAIARSLNLGWLHANFHTVAIATGAFGGVLHATRSMGLGSLPSRALAACLVFGTIVAKHALIYLNAWIDASNRRQSVKRHGV